MVTFRIFFQYSNTPVLQYSIKHFPECVLCLFLFKNIESFSPETVSVARPADDEQALVCVIHIANLQ